jgi:cytochrome c-type biogenesis protein CcmE
VTAVDPRSQASRPGGRRQGRLLLAVCLVLDVLIVWLLLGTDLVQTEHHVYAMNVEEAITELQRSKSPRRARVSGILVSGSLLRAASCVTRFRLRPVRFEPRSAGDRQPELGVIYGSCELPDTFCDLPGFELDVKVTGRLTGTASSPSLQADSVLTSCPAKYVVDRRACDTAPEAARRRCRMCF